MQLEINSARINRVLDSYIKHSGRSFTNEVNKRAFNIALKSVNKTPKVSAQKIKRDMLKGAKVQPTKSGKRKKRAPLAAILTNYFRGKQGKKGLWGAPMQKAVDRAIEHRVAGRAFMAAAWLGVARDIGPFVYPRRSVRSKTPVIGRAKGDGRPEKRLGSTKPTASGTHGSPDSAKISRVRQAMQMAINAETRDMLTYLRRKIPKEIRTIDKTASTASLKIS
jgi:hypothetical protein